MSENNENSAVAESFQTYDEVVDWILNRVPTVIKPGLKRMEYLMELLGHPERRMKVIHVAGTNGKGSTCAFLTRVLVESGYDVGTFTSPFIERYTSRIRYNEQDIPDEDLIRLANRLKPAVDEVAATELGSPTMFEISTALAILYFATVSFPDYVVWETGLGGRLDSTNIVAPVVSVITNVGHDHMDILGHSLEEIAMEKAGIIKAGVHTVTAIEQPELQAIIAGVCKEKKANLYMLGQNFQYDHVLSELDRQQFTFKGPFRQINPLVISLNGRHQLNNAAVAIMTIEVLRQYFALLVEDDALERAMRTTKWPGRLEMISQEPPILLDGAHNPEGAATLAQALTDTYTYDKLHLMAGMLSTKEHSGYLRHILPLVDTLIATEPDMHKALAAESFAEEVHKVAAELGHSVEVTVEPDWKQALKLLQQRTGHNELGVVSGTLYLISDVRSWIMNRCDSEKGW